ncbi:unnamed protein product [Lampetra planeri]
MRSSPCLISSPDDGRSSSSDGSDDTDGARRFRAAWIEFHARGETLMEAGGGGLGGGACRSVQCVAPVL